MIMRGNCLHRATSFRGSRRFTIAYKYRPYSPDGDENGSCILCILTIDSYQQSLDCVT